MPKVEEFKPKTTLHLENEMADKIMDKHDVGDSVVLLVKGKVVSKSVDSFGGKKRPSIRIEVASVSKNEKESKDFRNKLANRK